jgi:hypothetical protein
VGIREFDSSTLSGSRWRPRSRQCANAPVPRCPRRPYARSQPDRDHARVARWVGETGIATGLLTLFIRHTSASLLIQENADPGVQSDLERFLARLVPEGDALFEHVSEGPTTCRRTCAAR